MAVHRVTRILPYRPEELFALVGDVRAYPDFVPWISSIRVWNERETAAGVNEVDAEAQVGFAMIRERFATAVKRDCNQRMITVSLIRGPFKHLRNEWRFLPEATGTKVDFFIDFEFRSKLLDRVLQANFDRAAHRLIGCFETRAQALFGQPA